MRQVKYNNAKRVRGLPASAEVWISRCLRVLSKPFNTGARSQVARAIRTFIGPCSAILLVAESLKMASSL